MMGKAQFKKSVTKKRGAVAVLMAVSMVAVMGMAMLAIDVGLVYNAKTDLQRAADAAALAGVAAYIQDGSLGADHGELISTATEYAQNFSLKNATLHKPTHLLSADIELGRHDFENPNGALRKNGRWNAVEVTVRRSDSSPNGPIPLVFARVFGNYFANVEATARAAVDDRLSSYTLEDDTDGTGGLIPFTIHEDLFDSMSSNGPDDYTYDEGVYSGPDQISEVRLYVWKFDGIEEGLAEIGTEAEIVGSGNFGTINVGVTSESASVLSYQIANGVSASELETEFGADELKFYDEQGELITYPISGNPGLAISIESAVRERIGDLVGFFVHRGLTSSGGHAMYEVSGIRYGRIVAVELNGPPDNRALVIQPESHTDENVGVGDDAPSTDGKVTRIALVR